VFCLPPNTTHMCQPLDVTAFHCLKMYWDEECDRFMSTNPGKIVTIYQFSLLFSAAWARAMTPKPSHQDLKQQVSFLSIEGQSKFQEKYRPTQALPWLC